MKRLARNRHFYILIILGVVLSSCVKEMDFDGIKDVQLTPTISIDLMEAEITTAEVVEKIESLGIPSHLIDYGMEFPYSEKAPVDIASDERITKYLESATLYFETKNTTPRDITIRVELKNGADKTIDGGALNATHSASTDTPVIDSLVFTGGKVEGLKNLKNIEIHITVESGDDINQNRSGEFTLSSTGKFNFEYDLSNGLP